MKGLGKLKILAVVVLAAGLLAAAGLTGCSSQASAKIQVVTSTSLLEQLVRRAGGDKVDVINLVPAASHPGDFDASPADIQKLADAQLFLWHNWPGEIYVKPLIESADNPDLKVVAIDIPGSWMTPEVQLQAMDQVVATLSEIDPAGSAEFQAAGIEYKRSVQAAEDKVKAELAQHDLSKVNVISSGWQAGLVGWAGFNIIGTYGLPTPPTIADIQALVDKGREDGVSLVVDNLHNAPDQGKPIATELGCKRVILYNFPGVDEKTKTWEDTFETDIDMLLAALPD